MIGEDLEKLKERLYKKGGSLKDRTKRDAFPPSVNRGRVRSYWSEPLKEKKDSRRIIESMNRRKKTPIFLIFGLLFLFLAVVAVVYFLTSDGNIVSSRKIDLIIEGPSVIESGERNRWNIFITNNNKANLELADLIIVYPQGSLSSGGEALSKERRSIDSILSGGTVQQEINFFILGEEGEQKEISITLEYRMQDSNAIFAKSEKQIIKLSRSSMGISLNLPDEIESGQEMILKVEYVSNSDVVLKDTYLKVEYPPGFHFLEAAPGPVKGENMWSVGDLMPQEKRSLEIKGILEGQDLTELNFRALIGSNGEEGSLNVFGSIADSVLLKRPFINFKFLVNGKDVDFISGEKSLIITASWENNLPTEIRNTTIKVRLASDAIDLSSISVANGFYRSYDNTIVWNASSLPGLALIAPGEYGAAKFSFALKDIFPVKIIDDKNFTFILDGEIFGYSVNQDGQSFEVKSSVSKQVKIASHMQIASRLLYSSGAFSNSGPLPPRVGQETTYTVVWSISNFYNNVSDVIVRSSLPSYISWFNIVSPSDEDISYNVSSGELVWKIDRIESGTGILRPAKEIAFQIAFSPAPNQVGNSPVLVSQTSIEGKDLFTGLILRDVKQSLDTGSVEEAQSNLSLDRVVE